MTNEKPPEKCPDCEARRCYQMAGDIWTYACGRTWWAGGDWGDRTDNCYCRQLERQLAQRDAELARLTAPVPVGTTVKTLLKQSLVDHGYDGLCSPDGECGCGLDNLIPCMEPCDLCRPAYRGPGRYDGGDGDFGMYLTKADRDEAIKRAKEEGEQ